MKQIRSLILCAMLMVSCSVGAGRPEGSLTPEQARRVVAKVDRDLAKEITSLESDIQEAREALIQIASIGVLSRDSLKDAFTELATADYFMSRSWATLVEANNKGAALLLKDGQDALASCIKAVENAVERETKRRIF